MFRDEVELLAAAEDQEVLRGVRELAQGLATLPDTVLRCAKWSQAALRRLLVLRMPIGRIRRVSFFQV